MKATIKIDATPEEMRTLLGLPDIEALQQEVVEKLREKMLARIDSDSPADLMKLIMPSADQFSALETMQSTFWQAFAQDDKTSGGKDEK